jgi:membrane-bound serine protease (ClpP class)
MRVMCLLLLVLSFILPNAAAAAEPGPVGVIMTVTVADPIGPGVAEFVADAIQEASDKNAAALVILLDTPGAVVESQRRILQSKYASLVPVVV